MSVQVIEGDCLATLRKLPEASVQCCVTSPPYYGLRDYGVAGQIGLEETPEAFVARLVEVFREVRRVLRDDGTLWLNIGDSYAGSWGSQGRQGRTGQMASRSVISARQIAAHPRKQSRTRSTLHLDGTKPKDLMMIPAMVALALRADGWWLRSDIIWHKPNPMPESVTDRPTNAYEHVFLLSKAERYFYDASAVAEPITEATAKDRDDTGRFRPDRGFPGAASAGGGRLGSASTRNARNVWTIATQPFSGAHFATMPPDLAERCIKAGSRPGDTVLDPFGGAGTTGLVADRLGRSAVLCELNPAYAALARQRIQADAPLLAATLAAQPVPPLLALAETRAA